MSDIFFQDINREKLRGKTVILDVDGTIVVDGENQPNSAVMAKVAEIKQVSCVFFCSNKRNQENRNKNLSALLGVDFINSQHKKPSRKVVAGNNFSNSELVIIGDKILTDGLFSRNIGAEFIKVRRMLSGGENYKIKLIYLIDDFVTFILSLTKLLRPGQWLKNLLIFAPLFFAGEFFIWPKLSLVLWSVLIFCLSASAVYCFNDILDKNKDAVHPKKRFRPIASGEITFWQGYLVAVILAISSLTLSFLFVTKILALMVVYLLLNVLYSIYLKHIVILDVLLVSSFYLLRMLAGGFAADVFISRWIVLCTIFVALFIVVGKRRAELSQGVRRAVLDYYSVDFFDKLLVLTAGLTIVSYGVYSVLGPSSPRAVYSIFFVIFGIFRYLNLIYKTAEAEYPEKLVFKDRPLILSVLGWLVYMFLIFYGIL